MGPIVTVIDASCWRLLTGEVLARTELYALLSVLGEPVIFSTDRGREVWPRKGQRMIHAGHAQTVLRLPLWDNDVHRAYWADRAEVTT